MSAIDDLRLDAIETPEGRAIYPFGSRGAGYLADAATERRLRVYLTRPLWVILAFFILQSIVREFVVRVPELIAIPATYVVIFLFHYAVEGHPARLPARGLSAEFKGAATPEIRRGGRTATVFAHWCGFLVLLVIAVMIAIVTEGRERWSLEVTCLVCVVLLAVSLRRFEKILG